MIPRYSRPRMTEIWDPENRYRIWLEIETLAAEKMAELGTVPRGVPEAVRARGKFEVARIDEHADAIRCDYMLTESGGLHHGGESARSIDVVVGEKGVAWRRLRVRGTPGHGSMPFGSESAITALPARSGQAQRACIRAHPTAPTPASPNPRVSCFSGGPIW